jgi:hypothetical protein
MEKLPTLSSLKFTSNTERIYPTDLAVFANLTAPELKWATMAHHAQQLGVIPTHLARASRTATWWRPPISRPRAYCIKPKLRWSTQNNRPKTSRHTWILAAQPTLHVLFSNIPA